MNPLQIAWLNMMEGRVRTLISLIGVAFTVFLMLMQLGFLGAVVRTATQLYDHLEFDLLLVSGEYATLRNPGTLPRGRLALAREVEGVQTVLPLAVSRGFWHGPHSGEYSLPPSRSVICMLGVDPATLGQVFAEPDRYVFRDSRDLASAATALTRSGTILLDRTSRPEFGTPELRRPGCTTEMNNTVVEIVGEFEIGTGFDYMGVLLTSEDTFHTLTRWPGSQVSFGLVKLAPGTALEQARQAVQDAAGPTVRVLTREHLNESECDYWVKQTSVGQFFGLGVLVALLVGGIFVYQMMAGEIRSRMSAFATAKAIGYTNRYLDAVVLSKALLLALLGFSPGLALALVFYKLTRDVASVPMAMTLGRAAGVLGLTFLMCLCSGLLAVRRAHTANPADLF
jgi:putative ABC transport system permease protein